MAEWRDQIILIGVVGFLILNYSFMLIRPAGLPIGEVLLLVSLCLIPHHKVLPKFLRHPIILPFGLWLLAGLMHLSIDIVQYGLWAVRDASHVIESLFLYVGFAYAGKTHSINRLSRWFPRVMGLLFLYSFLYPFRDVLAPYMPMIANMSGYEIPLFVHTNTSFMLVVGSGYFFRRYLHRVQAKQARHLWLGIALVTMALLFFPSRTLYLQIGVMLGYFAFIFRHRGLHRILGDRVGAGSPRRDSRGFWAKCLWPVWRRFCHAGLSDAVSRNIWRVRYRNPDQ